MTREQAILASMILLSMFCFACSERPAVQQAPPIQEEAQCLRTMDHPHCYSGIHKAAEDGDIKTALSLLARSPELVNYRDLESSDTPLILATVNGKKEMVALLLARGALPNYTDRQGFTPLKIVAAYGCQYFYSHLDCSEQRKLVAKLPAREIAKLLIDHGANVNAIDNQGMSPLHYAARCGGTEVVWLLLDHGADVNLRDSDQRTPLWDALNPYFCMDSQSGAITKMLLVRRATLYPNSILYPSSARLEVAISVYQYNQNPDEVTLAVLNRARWSHGKTPLIQALDDGNTVAALAFIEGPETGPQAGGESGWSPLHTAAEKGTEAIVAALLAKRFDVNAAAVNGDTPLYLASMRGDARIVKLLIEHGAQVNPNPNGFGASPLHAAIKSGNQEVVRLLLAHGANPNPGKARYPDKKDVDNFILAVFGKRDWSAEIPSAQAIDPFSERVKTIDSYSTTELLSLLIAQNLNDPGKTPLEIAIEKGDTTIVELIKKSGGK